MTAGASWWPQAGNRVVVRDAADSEKLMYGEVEAEDDEIVMDSLTVFLRYLADEAEAQQARPGGSREAREVVNEFLPTGQEMAPELVPLKRLDMSEWNHVASTRG